MGSDNSEEIESVRVSMEIEGEYEDVLSKLATDGSRSERYTSLVEDMDAILETVLRIDGGTRSAIADSMPDETTAPYDAEAVVTALQVLARYDLVELEDNTWRPGPALRE